MGTRGKRSFAERSLEPVADAGSTTRQPDAVPIPRGLSQAEAEVFHAVISGPGMYTPDQGALIANYSRLAVLCDKLAAAGDGAYVRTAAVLLRFATALRLSTQARVHPESIGRRAARHEPVVDDRAAVLRLSEETRRRRGELA